MCNCLQDELTIAIRKRKFLNKFIVINNALCQVFVVSAKKELESCQHGSFVKLSKQLKGSPYSITERRVPELIPVLGSQPAGDVSHKPDGRLPLLSARPAVTPATLKRAATNFAAW